MGVMITGTITDKATGKPVAGARLHYLPFLENTFVQALPEFDKDGNVEGFQHRYVTGADGTYKLVGMPGRAIVGVDGDGKVPYRSGAGSEAIKGLDKNGLLQDLVESDLARAGVAEHACGDQPGRADGDANGRCTTRPGAERAHQSR